MNKKPQEYAGLNIDVEKKIGKEIKEFSPFPQKVKIIAVTKTLPYEAIKEAYQEKIYNIGENQVNEAIKKIENKKAFKKGRIHLIGHLQTNKVKKAVKLFDYIQSVDTIKVAKKINIEAKQIKKKQKIYLQINIGEDPKKYGFLKKNIIEACQIIVEMKNIEVKGIMTILPLNTNKEKTTKLYKQTSKICKKIQKEHIQTCIETSMGMSGDYRQAICCGATNLRIGTKLYGKRK